MPFIYACRLDNRCYITKTLSQRCAKCFTPVLPDKIKKIEYRTLLSFKAHKFKEPDAPNVNVYMLSRNKILEAYDVIDATPNLYANTKYLAQIYLYKIYKQQ